MANIPTIQQLYSSALNNLRTELGITNSLEGKVFLNALAAVQAAKLKLFYLYAAKVQKNIFVDTADPESMGGTLERFGFVKLGRYPFPASAGIYEVDVTGDIGATINAGVTFKSDDNAKSPGLLYILDTSFTFVATTGKIQLRALTVGTDAKLEVNDTLTATAPLLNANSEATVSSEITAPIVAEDTEDYRRKVLESFQLEPQGGARGDYRIWAADASGVKTVYPYAVSGSVGEINLYIEAEPDSSDPIGSGIPPASMIADVESVIELDPDTTKPINERGRRPLGVYLINYLPIVPKDVDIIVNSLNYQSSEETDAIYAAVEEYLSNIRPYIAGADDPNAISDTIYISQLTAVISNAISPGNFFTNITFKVNGVDVSTYQFINGNIPKLNQITY